MCLEICLCVWIAAGLLKQPSWIHRSQFGQLLPADADVDTENNKPHFLLPERKRVSTQRRSQALKDGIKMRHCWNATFSSSNSSPFSELSHPSPLDFLSQTSSIINSNHKDIQNGNINIRVSRIWVITDDSALSGCVQGMFPWGLTPNWMFKDPSRIKININAHTSTTKEVCQRLCLEDAFSS